MYISQDIKKSCEGAHLDVKNYWNSSAALLNFTTVTTLMYMVEYQYLDMPNSWVKLALVFIGMFGLYQTSVIFRDYFQIETRKFMFYKMARMSIYELTTLYQSFCISFAVHKKETTEKTSHKIFIFSKVFLSKNITQPLLFTTAQYEMSF